MEKYRFTMFFERTNEYSAWFYLRIDDKDLFGILMATVNGTSLAAFR